MAYSPFNPTPYKVDPRIAALMPDPRSINMVAPAPPKRPGLLSRVGNGLLDRFMPAPQSGLLTEEDIKNARRQGLIQMGAGLLAAGGPSANQGGTLANLGAAMQGGQQAYQGAADHALARRGAEQQLQLGQQQIAQGQSELAGQQSEQQLAAARQKLLAENPPPTDPAGYVEWAKQMHAKLTQLGDFKFADHLKTIIATQGGQQGQREPGTWVTVPGPNGQPMKRYVTAAEAGQGIEEYQAPTRDTNEALTLNARLTGERREQDHYNKEIEGVQTTVDAYMGAKEAAKMRGAGDLQVLYSFIRALDPGSVVRGEELVLAQQAAPLRAQAEILKQRFEKEGGALSQTQRDQMIQLMKQMVELKTARAENALKNARSRASRFGLEVDFYDPLENYRAYEERTKKTAEAAQQQPGPYKSGYVFPQNDYRSTYGSAPK